MVDVEVKLRLPSQEAFTKFLELISPYHKVTKLQENVFFDGINGELTAKKVVLFLRFYGHDDMCVVTMKGKAMLVDGISRVAMVFEELEDPKLIAMARACVAHPSKLHSLDCELVRKVLQDFDIGDDIVCLGSFKNIRRVYEWQGLNLDVDETHFPFGTAYEIECETSYPEEAKSLLEDFLQEHNIPFTNSTKSKFATFSAGRLV